MLASTRPSQSYHHAKSDFSMPESFDSVDVTFSHLPRSSSFVSIITSSTSSFRFSFLASPFQLLSSPLSPPSFISSISPSSTQEARLPSPFVELTSFQLFRLVRQCLFFVRPNFHFVSTLSSSLTFHTGIRSSDVLSQRN